MTESLRPALIPIRRLLAGSLRVLAGTLFFLGLAATVGLPVKESAHEPRTALAETLLESWPRFRGPSASGTTSSGGPLPIQMVPVDAEWKTALPAGHSSPVWFGSKLFITGYDEVTNKFEILGLDRRTGEILWRTSVLFEELQPYHPISNPATSTPAVDAERVYVYFASAGLFAFSHNGDLVWNLPLDTPAVRYGSSTSPIVSGDRVFLATGGGENPILLAADLETGKVLWKVPGSRSSEYGSSSTPLLWNGQLVVHSWGQIQGFDPADGERLWWLNAPTQGNSSPFSSEDTLYVSTWSFGEEELHVPLPSFDQLLQRANRAADDSIPVMEFPTDVLMIRRMESENIEGANIFVKPGSADTDKGGSINRSEWAAFMARRPGRLQWRHGLLALRPNQRGRLPKSAVFWREERGVSEVPTPLLYLQKVFMVTNGGVLTCLEQDSGKLIYRGRLGAGSPYYASPVASGGHVYFASSEGVLSTIRVGSQLEVVAMSDFGESIYATPALARDRVYLRTAGHLYSFTNQ